MAKIPYFPFYPDDWLSSSRIDLLTAEQERGYLRLLCRAWNMPDCTLPANEEHLLRWSRISDANALRTLLRTLWERTANGWQNAKLYALWLKAQSKHEMAVKSASARYLTNSKPANAERTHCERPANQNQNQNHIQNHKKKSQKKAQAPFVLPEWVDAKTWAAFEEMRKKIRKPMTDHARELVVKALEEFKVQGNDPAAVLNQSVRKSWQDVYPVKEKSNGSQNGRFAREELLNALKNKNNVTMPVLSDSAKALFYAINKNWRVLQAEVEKGEGTI